MHGLLSGAPTSHSSVPHTLPYSLTCTSLQMASPCKGRPFVRGLEEDHSILERGGCVCVCVCVCGSWGRWVFTTTAKKQCISKHTQNKQFFPKETANQTIFCHPCDEEFYFSKTNITPLLFKKCFFFLMGEKNDYFFVHLQLQIKFTHSRANNILFSDISIVSPQIKWSVPKPPKCGMGPW